MRKLRIEDAIGERICHDMTAIRPDGFKGVLFPRGHQITPEDIPRLLDIGKSHVFVWDPGVDEVHEDDAALAIAEAVAGLNVRYSGPSEGKYQFAADCDGLFAVDSEALRQINAVDDYTVVCRPGHTPVRAGEKLGGARIVPLVTQRANVTQAVDIARASAPVFSVLPYRPLKTGIVITGSEVYYGRIHDRFEKVLRAKLAPLETQVLGVTKVPDDLTEILAAVQGFLDAGAELILLSGGMSVDPDDLTPTAIRQTGAQVITQGVPMQPGNMLMMAYLGDVMLMGVPGGSLHSQVTSVDVFLPRLFAGLRIGPEDVAGLGEGGFCMQCETCHYPICYFGFSR